MFKKYIYFYMTSKHKMHNSKYHQNQLCSHISTWLIFWMVYCREVV